jgi:hypothetical protein
MRVRINKREDLKARDDLTADALLAQLADATPAQIDTWLTNNVTNLAQARRVFKLLLLVMRALVKKKMI